MARFVVDSTGRVDRRSVTILSSTNKAFGEAVRSGFGQTRFTPAQIEGRPVSEIMDLGFHFRPHLLAIDAMDRP